MMRGAGFHIPFIHVAQVDNMLSDTGKVLAKMHKALREN